MLWKGIPGVRVHDNGIVRMSVKRPYNVFGNLVPPLPVPRTAASNPRVENAPLQGWIHIGEGYELSFSAQAIYQVSKRNAVSSGFQTLKVAERIEGPLAVKELVRVIVVKDDLPTETVPDDSDLIISDRCENLILSWCIREEAVEFSDFDEGPSPADKVAG